MSLEINFTHEINNSYDDDGALQSCKKCNLPIYEGHAYELGDDRWHINCFKCSKCESSLGCNSNFLVLGNGNLICSNCSYNCKQCGKKIDDLAILTGDQAYCSSCFKCRSCKLKIEDLRYARTSKGLFCMSCHEKLIAKKKKVDLKKKQLALLEQQRLADEKQANLKNPNYNTRHSHYQNEESRHLQDISNNNTTPKLSNGSSKRNSLNNQNGHNASSDLFLHGNRSSSSMVTNKDKSLPPPPPPPPPHEGEYNSARDSFHSTKTDNSITSISNSQFTGTTNESNNDKNHQPTQVAPSQSQEEDFSIEEVNDSDDELNMKKQKLEKGVSQNSSQSDHNGIILDIIDSMSEPTTPKVTSSRKDSNSLEPPVDLTPKNKESVSKTENPEDKVEENESPSKKFRGKNLLILSPNQYHDNGFHNANNIQPSITSPRKNNNTNLAPEEHARSNCPSPFAKANRQARVVETNDEIQNEGLNLDDYDSYYKGNNKEMGTPKRPNSGNVTTTVMSSPPPKAPLPSVPSTPIKSSIMSTETPRSETRSLANEPRGLGLEGVEYPEKKSQRSSRIIGNVTPAVTNLEDTLNDNEYGSAQSQSQGQTSVSRKNTIRTPKLSLKHKRSISNGSNSGITGKFGFFKSKDENNVMSSSGSIKGHSRHVSDGSISNGGSAFTTPPLPFTSPMNQLGFSRDHTRSTSDTPFLASIDNNNGGTLAGQQTDLHRHELELRSLKADIYQLEIQKQTLNNDVKKLTNDKSKLNQEVRTLQSRIVKDSNQQQDLSKEIGSLEIRKKKLLEINQSLSEENHQLELSIKNGKNGGSATSINAHPSPPIGPGSQGRRGSSSDITNDSTSNSNFTNLASTSSSSLIAGAPYSETGIDTDTTMVETHKATRLKFWRRPKISNVNSPVIVNTGVHHKESQDLSNSNNGEAINSNNGSGAHHSHSNSNNHHNGSNGNSTLDPSLADGSNNKKGLGSFITKSRSTNILDSFLTNNSNNNSNDSTPSISENGGVSNAPLFTSTVQRRADYENERVPLIVTKCIEEVEKRGLDMEGIYRISGGNSAIVSIENAFSGLTANASSDEKQMNKLNETIDVDINAVTSALKRYLRKLPDPLIPYNIYDDFIKVSSANAPNKSDKRLLDLKNRVIAKLPPANKHILFLLCKHLSLVNSYQSVNRMGYKNLSVVFAPTLARDATGEKEMVDMGYRNDVTEFLLNNHEQVFEGYS